MGKLAEVQRKLEAIRLAGNQQRYGITSRIKA